MKRGFPSHNAVVFVVSLASVLFACQKEPLKVSRNFDEYAIYKSWLNQYGGVMSEGTIPFASRDGMVTGVLNWNAASRYSYEDENYLDVPFVFDGKEYMTSQGTDQSLKFNLVFRNNANGDIEAALRTSFRTQTDGENADATLAKAYDTYMLMNGDAATVWIDEGQNYFEKRRPLSYAEARRIKTHEWLRWIAVQ